MSPLTMVLAHWAIIGVKDHLPGHPAMKVSGPHNQFEDANPFERRRKSKIWEWGLRVGSRVRQ